MRQPWAFILPQTKVGVTVSGMETANVTGGTCYAEDANANTVSVCSDNCGHSSVKPRVEHSGGKAAAGLVCKSVATCTYGGVGSANCNSGG